MCLQMVKINPMLFDWLTWRNGGPIDIFGIPLRQSTILVLKHMLHKYAIGYCDGESLVCRPKVNHKAVMFFKDGICYWFHMTNDEFKKVFGFV